MNFQWYSVKNQWILVQILFKIPWFSLIFVWKNMNLHVLIDKNHQKQSKTIKNCKILPGAFSKFFPIFLVKCDFLHFSPLFPSAPWMQIQENPRISAKLGFPNIWILTISRKLNFFWKLFAQWSQIYFFMKNYHFEDELGCSGVKYFSDQISIHFQIFWQISYLGMLTFEVKSKKSTKNQHT